MLVFNTGVSCILTIIFCLILWFTKKSYWSIPFLCTGFYVLTTQTIDTLWLLPAILVLTTIPPKVRNPIGTILLFILLVHGILTMNLRMHGILGNANMMGLLFIFGYFGLDYKRLRPLWLFGLVCTMSIGSFIAFVITCIMTKHKPDVMSLFPILLGYLTIYLFPQKILYLLGLGWLLVYVFIPKREVEIKGWVYLLVLLASVMILLWFRPSYLARGTERLAMSKDAIDAIIKYPMGIGYRNWEEMFPQYFTSMCHNSYLHILCEQGIICAIPLLAGVYSIVKSKNPLGVALCIHALGDFTFSASAIWLGYFLLAQRKDEPWQREMTENEKFILIMIMMGVAIWRLMTVRTISIL